MLSHPLPSLEQPPNRIFVQISSISRSLTSDLGSASVDEGNELSQSGKWRDLSEGMDSDEMESQGRMGLLEKESSVQKRSPPLRADPKLVRRLRSKKRKSLRLMPSLYTGDNTSQSDTIAPFSFQKIATTSSPLRPLFGAPKSVSFNQKSSSPKPQTEESLLKRARLLGMTSISHASIFAQKSPASPTKTMNAAEQRLLEDNCFQYAQYSVWYVVSTHAPTRQLVTAQYEKDPLLLLVRNKTRTKDGFSTYGGLLSKVERFSKIKELLRGFLRKSSKCLILKSAAQKPPLEEIEKNPEILYYATELYYVFQKHAKTGLLPLEHYRQFLRVVYSLLIPDHCTVERENAVQEDTLNDSNNNMDGVIQFDFCKRIVELAWIWMDSNSALEVVAFLRYMHLHCVRVVRQSPQQLVFLKPQLPAAFAGVPQKQQLSLARPHTVMEHNSPSKGQPQWKTKRRFASENRKLAQTLRASQSIFSRLYRVTSNHGLSAGSHSAVETIDQLQASLPAPLNQRRFSRLSLSAGEVKLEDLLSESIPQDFHGKIAEESKRHLLNQYQKYLRAEKECDLSFYFESPQIVASHSRLVQDPNAWNRFSLQSSLEARGRHLEEKLLLAPKVKVQPTRSTLRSISPVRHERKRAKRKRSKQH